MKGQKDRKVKFGYEDLEVWKRAVDFAVSVIDVVESLETSRKHFRLLEQIETSSCIHRCLSPFTFDTFIKSLRSNFSFL